ncbi:hypothetical protein EX895_006268 [Sporisorium graminicola]|uniref:GATA-type domain-containing protein n=1 Tax=Sporisorium graminicola TaxID=280036 RepID=A0A4U7KPU3_9BASI|nr:hypothetical protein EX895_006268 [Sporisorium graminicola]TKY85188.1 hypothetical protein EX895_006268 [Sporisorium graminicola]
MTMDMSDDMLVDTSFPAPQPSVAAKELDAASTTPPLLSADDDVELPSIPIPDEAALAAAAAAMAAAAQGQAEGLAQQQQQQQQQQHTADHNDLGGASEDLDSYLLAAAAASVHAQQQHLSDDQQKAQSEQNFDIAATSIPNGTYTIDASVNGSNVDDARARAAVQDRCQKYIDDRTPFPLTIGNRTPGGVAELLASSNVGQHDSQNLAHLPLTEAKVELGKTRCYWALLSADHSKGNGPTGEKLEFVYLDPILQQHMAEQASQMVGSDFYDYVHPEERDRVCDDMQKIVESRTLFGSVTRCRYSRIPHIRELLGASNPPRDPEADRYVEDDSFVAIDIIINWIGDGMLLCFFHAIIDKAAEDNDEQNKSEWTNWCGTPGGSFTVRQCDTIWKQVKAVPRETIAASGPDHVFQVIEAGGDSRVLLSWPPPRLFSGHHVEANLLAQSDTTAFQDGSYFADDFARLAQGVSIAPGSSSLSDANTSCTRRFRAKHTLTSEGKVRSIESVLIPYGGVILACFHTTFQQELPPTDPKLVLQARASLEAQAERRKADDHESPSSSNKRQRTDGGPVTSDNSMDAKPQMPTSVAASTLSPSRDGAPASASTEPSLKPQDCVTAATDGSHAQSNGHSTKAVNGSPPKPVVSKYQKPAIKPEANGLAALANPSLMYTNAPIKAPGTPTSTAAAAATNAARAGSERTPSTPAAKAANGRSNHVASPSPATTSSATGASPGASPNKACTGCGKINSPEWRRGPSGHKTLCNACGLRYARSLTRRKKKKGKDGEVEFIEPTGDPTVVPKSRGGGGGSLPGVHRKNSKKRKEEEAAKEAATAVAGVVASVSPSASASSAEPMQSPAAGVVAEAKVPSPAPAGGDKLAASKRVKVEPVEGSTLARGNSVSDDKEASLSALAPAAAATEVVSDPAHSIAVSIALDAIAQATSSAPLIDAEGLALPVSNAISRAIAATISSTDSSSSAALAAVSPHTPSGILSTAPSTTASPTAVDLDPAVSAAALQTIESVVSEALYKQLVHSSLPETPPADVKGGTKEEEGERQVDLTEALTADAIRAAAQAAVAQGVAEE